MTIAVNMVYLPGQPPVPDWIVQTLLQWMAERPHTSFVWLCNQASPQVAALPHVQQQVCKLPARNSLRWQWWYQYSLPALLKKYQAQAIVQATGLCSKRCKLPQYLVLSSLYDYHLTGATNKVAAFWQRQLPQSLQQATHVFTTTQLALQMLQQQWPAAGDSYSVIYPRPLPHYVPISYTQQQQVQAQYTAERAFWLYRGSSHTPTLIQLLKAFTQFKKWQKSSMPMVLALTHTPNDEWSKALASYKYRDQVVVLPALPHETLALIVAAAYGCFLLDETEPLLQDMLQAMACQVPVVAALLPSTSEWLQDAAVLVPAHDTTQLTASMNSLFKDEDLRHQYIQKGMQLVAQFQSADAVAALHAVLPQ